LNLLIKSQQGNSDIPEGNRNVPPACTTFVQNGVRDNAKTGPDEGPIDAELAVIIERWPDLPEAIKAGIVAMVHAASGLTPQ